MFQRWQTALLMIALLCGLTGSIQWSDPPSKVLFDRASSAADYKKFEVARITLQTLNTYPDSDYTAKAKIELEKLDTAECNDSFNTSPRCVDPQEANEADQ